MMLRKQILGLFLSLISTPVLCTDVTCPEDYPIALDPEDVNIKWESVLVLEGQNLVTVVLANKFKGEYLYDVSLTVGESRFDKSGVRQSSPDITTSLRIDQNKRDSSFKFVLGKTELPMKLSILYGEYCGYKIEIGINEFIKSDKSISKSKSTIRSKINELLSNLVFGRLNQAATWLTFSTSIPSLN